ncbi:MAG: hypothetical protein K6C13_15565 [Oscillospiraceae bacterium]|nr:hypothetical protein [Oscillospiraceae bacterium]
MGIFDKIFKNKEKVDKKDELRSQQRSFAAMAELTKDIPSLSAIAQNELDHITRKLKGEKDPPDYKKKQTELDNNFDMIKASASHEKYGPRKFGEREAFYQLSALKHGISDIRNDKGKVTKTAFDNNLEEIAEYAVLLMKNNKNKTEMSFSDKLNIGQFSMSSPTNRQKVKDYMEKMPGFEPLNDTDKQIAQDFAKNMRRDLLQSGEKGELGISRALTKSVANSYERFVKDSRDEQRSIDIKNIEYDQAKKSSEKYLSPDTYSEHKEIDKIINWNSADHPNENLSIISDNGLYDIKKTKGFAEYINEKVEAHNKIDPESQSLDPSDKRYKTPIQTCEEAVNGITDPDVKAYMQLKWMQSALDNPEIKLAINSENKKGSPNIYSPDECSAMREKISTELEHLGTRINENRDKLSNDDYRKFLENTPEGQKIAQDINIKTMTETMKTDHPEIMSRVDNMIQRDIDNARYKAISDCAEWYERAKNSKEALDELKKDPEFDKDSVIPDKIWEKWQNEELSGGKKYLTKLAGFDYSYADIEKQAANKLTDKTYETCADVCSTGKDTQEKASAAIWRELLDKPRPNVKTMTDKELYNTINNTVNTAMRENNMTYTQTTLTKMTDTPNRTNPNYNRFDKTATMYDSGLTSNPGMKNDITSPNP